LFQRPTKGAANTDGALKQDKSSSVNTVTQLNKQNQSDCVADLSTHRDHADSGLALTPVWSSAGDNVMIRLAPCDKLYKT
jgi:hypothetical protein